MILVMTRVPEPGRVKTRLIPLLGPAGAAHLAAAMAGDTIDVVRATGLPWRLCLDGPLDHPWVRLVDAPEVEPQAGADLGERLTWALRDGGVAIGTDSPTLPRPMLQEAHGSTADVVIAPAFDGGYVLVGVQDASAIFEEVPWSTAGTFAAQVARARHLGRSVRVLPFWYDVDEPRDLELLRHHLTTLPDALAPRTRAFLDALPEP